MSAYEGSKMQEEDERRKKYTSDEAVKMAVDTVKGMGLSDYYKSLIDEAEKRGYEKAVNEMKAALNKMFNSQSPDTIK